MFDHLDFDFLPDISESSAFIHLVPLKKIPSNPYFFIILLHIVQKAIFENAIKSLYYFHIFLKKKGANLKCMKRLERMISRRIFNGLYG